MDENINPETEKQEIEMEEPVVTEPEAKQSDAKEQAYQDPNADLYNSQNQQQTVQGEDLDTSPLSLGDSLITMILFAIPFVNIIVAIVWACGGSKNITRRNLSRAQLIIWGAVIILVLVFYAVLFGTIFGALYR